MRANTPRLTRQPNPLVVKQDCTSSAMLFNIYLERIFQIPLEGSEIGLKVNELPLSNLRYTGNTTFRIESIKEVEELLDRTDATGRRGSLSINFEKTKYMVVSCCTQIT